MLYSEQDAMGADEYHPLTRRGSNFSTHGGIGYMVIDAIDTMYLMGLEEEYQRARNWMVTSQTFDRDGNFNTFEVCTFPSALIAAEFRGRRQSVSLEACYPYFISLRIDYTWTKRRTLRTACYPFSTLLLELLCPWWIWADRKPLMIHIRKALLAPRKPLHSSWNFGTLLMQPGTPFTGIRSRRRVRCL
jgi:hypothetical protein